jgi:hypothetical protein
MLTCVHVGAGHQSHADMGQNGQSDQELGDLGAGQALGEPCGQPNFAGGQEIVGVHDGVHREVQPHNPRVERSLVHVGHEPVVEGGHVVVPMLKGRGIDFIRCSG